MKFLLFFVLALILNNSNSFEHDLLVITITYVLWGITIFEAHKEFRKEVI